MKIEEELLIKWKKSVNHTETIQDRLEESLRDNIKKHEIIK
jgi:hypothetical protein